MDPMGISVSVSVIQVPSSKSQGRSKSLVDQQGQGRSSYQMLQVSQAGNQAYQHRASMLLISLAEYQTISPSSELDE